MKKYQLKIKVKHTKEEYYGELFDNPDSLKAISKEINEKRPMLISEVIIKIDNPLTKQ